MPYKKEYNRQTIKEGGTRTPKTVMGNKGQNTSVPFDPKLHNKSQATKTTKFPK